MSKAPNETTHLLAENPADQDRYFSGDRASPAATLIDDPESSSSTTETATGPFEPTPAKSPSLLAETGATFLSSAPVILAYALQNSIQTASVLIVGRLGQDELSAAAFSMMLAMVTGWCVALGGTTALDTLGSASFTSPTTPRTAVSAHLQRCIVILHVLLIPVIFLWVFSAPVLRLLGQEEQLCVDVQRFLRVLIVGAPGYICFESLKKYLQCQGILQLSTIILVFTSPINIGLNYVLVHYTALGFLGSPLAISITYWISFFALAFCSAFSPQHKANGTWGGLLPIGTLLAWRPCWEFVKLAIPGIIMVGTEWWAFEIVAIAAGRLGSLPLAAQSVIMTTDQVLNTIPFGIGVAASQRVGNAIGAEDAKSASRAGHAAALLSVILGALIMTIMIATKDVFGYLFSDEVDVVRLVSVVMPLVASFQIADGLAGSCGGTLRGQGRQHLGAIFNIVAYYVIALPLGIFLAFKRSQGLYGLWVGQVVALYLVGASEYAVVWLWTNWEGEVDRGRMRAAIEDAVRKVPVGVSLGASA
ncbi:MATE efflux family protein [Sistotremastrum suecicum HHB10207 ss-3]|uniref:MATE efflux family protein n=1 Tax=Sistotremastrum suecicum HHB10207 ss-3 TaxID=1314776 RepID=A0A166F7C1_9AGAM|nr:MATE efflux family protein [Sistotremastrum suecicum HHB10207 ss-3]